MNSFRSWYLNNQTEITWFLIGWLTLCGLENLNKGDYTGAAISFILAGINYKFSQ